MGIPVNNIMLGDELENVTDDKLAARIDNFSLFAKTGSFTKTQSSKGIAAKRTVVGFLVDGINDAGALKDADFGMSADSASGIAKESADIFLLKNDISVLRKGVVYSRRTFGNILKYIKKTNRSNFVNMSIMLGASSF